jgi:hypothetical protein
MEINEGHTLQVPALTMSQYLSHKSAVDSLLLLPACEHHPNQILTACAIFHCTEFSLQLQMDSIRLN